MSEHSEQVAVIRWARLFEREYPDLRWLHSSLNGAHLTPRHAATMKAAGMTKGIPDLFLPVKTKHCSGLYLELKFGKNTLTEEQAEFFEFAKKQGFQVVLIRSFDQAIETLINYLKGEL